MKLVFVSALKGKGKRAIITSSWFETALDYKPRILQPKIEEHKLSATLTALQYKPQLKIYKPRVIMARVWYAYLFLCQIRIQKWKKA